jgi:hypothetical protein
MNNKLYALIAILGISIMLAAGYSNIASAEIGVNAGAGVTLSKVKLPTITACEDNTGCHHVGGETIGGKTIGDSISLKVTH